MNNPDNPNPTYMLVYPHPCTCTHLHVSHLPDYQWLSESMHCIWGCVASILSIHSLRGVLWPSEWGRPTKVQNTASTIHEKTCRCTC